MKIKIGGLLALLALVSALLLGSGTLSPHPQAETSPPTSREALGLMRTINTAEAEIFIKGHQYASLQDLLQHRSFQANANSPVAIDRATGQLKGYKVAVICSADGQHYVAEYAPTSGCSAALFSDESGVIFTATPLGCPNKQFNSEKQQ